MSASVNLPLHHESRSSLLAPAHPGGPGERGRKMVALWCGVVVLNLILVLFGDIMHSQLGKQPVCLGTRNAPFYCTVSYRIVS